jgi:hypothetical protein
MSKKIPAEIQCPSCHNKFNVELYRIIWIEEPKNRELIFSDELNAVTCPSCNKKTKLKFPFLATNVKKEIAIWYEPYHDDEIDKDVALYKAKMGKDSFYAKAPRIQNWEEFKQRIIESENKRQKGSKVNLSEDMVTSFSGFTNHIEKENKKRNTPKFLKHLSTIKGRLTYSFLPFLLLLLALFADKGTRLFSNIQRDLDGFLAIAIAWYVGSFIVFTLLYWGITKVSKYWSVRKDLRLWVFGSGFWIVGVFLYVIIVDPYNNGSWRYMDDDEYFHMFFVMLIPPIFIGSAKHVYEKYIK